MILEVEEIIERLTKSGFRLESSRSIDYGIQLRFSSGVVICHYPKRNKFLIQGKRVHLVKSILGFSKRNFKSKPPPKISIPLVPAKQLEPIEIITPEMDPTPPWDD